MFPRFIAFQAETAGGEGGVVEFVLVLQACSIQFALFGVGGFHRTFRAQTGMVLLKLVTVAHDPLP